MQQANLAERRVAETLSADEKIQLFVPKFRTRETLAAIEECLERGWTGMGFKTVEFEKQWQAYCGVPHAHFLNSATAALHMAVVLPKEKFGWKDGDEIITTSMTFVSTNHAILYAGLKRRSWQLRTAGFALFGVSLAKLFLYDLAFLSPLTRALSFVAVGAVLLFAGFFYQRLSEGARESRRNGPRS